MEDSTLKLVKATLITIVMLVHHVRGTMDMLWGNVHGAPLLESMSMVPRPQAIYIFFNFTIPKMTISTIKDSFFLFLSAIKIVLIDKGSPSNMPVDMSIVPHPHVHSAPSSA